MKPILWFSCLMVAIPALFFLGAMINQQRPRWSLSLLGAGLTLSLSVLLAGIIAFGERPLTSIMWLNASPVILVMLVLISFVALVILRYSRHYLAGEPYQARYLFWLHLTLAAVATVIVSNHLLVLLVAWIGISLGLHQLLMLYPQRPRAALAAHKKFLFARLAELALLMAFLLLYDQHGSWWISEILAAYPVSALSWQQQLAAGLIALAALIKCAQLPAHGWLMQVMEAPTPVSALLHAGIINLGGFLLILFAPLLVQATPAQWLLLTVAGVSTVLAGLITMTRISIKVKLAWSTSAQMGLMLVECALGLFDLALLHLLAHSCYKAYAFLNAGSAVEQNMQHRLAPAVSPGYRHWGVALGLSLAGVGGWVWLQGFSGPYSPWLLLAFALTLVLAERHSASIQGRLLSLLAVALMLAGAYQLQKSGIHLIASPLATTAGLWADVWVALLFTLLFTSYGVLRYRPDSALVQRFYINLYAGFYLDEWVTKTTLRIWPTHLPIRANAKALKVLHQEVAQ